MASASQTKRDQIVELIRQWADEHGDPPRAADWKNVRDLPWPSYLTVIRAFGSWDEGIRSAGFQPRGRGRPK